MKIHPIIADTGRLIGAAANLLNAGWTFTTAVPLPDGGYTLPGQALAVFIEGTWAELNRPHRMLVELMDDEGQPAHFLAPGDPQPVRVEQEITIPSVPTRQTVPQGSQQPCSICPMARSESVRPVAGMFGVSPLET